MATAAPQRYRHEAVIYGSDDELLAVLDPFLRDGMAAGEHVLVCCGERVTELVRRDIGTDVATATMPWSARQRPASAIKEFRTLVADCVRRGVERIRIVGEVPHPGTGGAWGWWARYEAAVNRALGPFPVWGLCPYDERITPPGVLADVRATHPFIGGAPGPNPAFVEPDRFLALRPPALADPIEGSAPPVDLAAPSPREARDAVGWLAVDTTIPREDVDALAIGVSEVVTNAILHGAPPVRVRAWEDGDRVVVAVSDGGAGPADPFVGLVPPDDEDLGGRGLWITHQLCDDVAMSASADGFRVRLVAGRVG